MLELISYFNFVLALTISAAYFYQLVYLMYGLVSLRKPWIFVAQKQHRYAVMISARNEEEVIGELIGSLTSQNYPRELLDIYVVADNCTDDTAGAARRPVPLSMSGLIPFTRARAMHWAISSMS